MTVRKYLAQEEEYRVRDTDRSADGDREPRGPVTAAGRRFVREWPDRQTGGPSEYAVGVALAIEAEAALLAHPTSPDPAGPQEPDQSMVEALRNARVGSCEISADHHVYPNARNVLRALMAADFMVVRGGEHRALLARRAPGDRGLREALEAFVAAFGVYLTSSSVDDGYRALVAADESARRALRADSRPEEPPR